MKHLRISALPQHPSLAPVKPGKCLQTIVRGVGLHLATDLGRSKISKLGYLKLASDEPVQMSLRVMAHTVRPNALLNSAWFGYILANL